ncbi:acetyltransferase [Flavobacterium odoriferum]|uniref:acetyltransferase n=1 Tax=Flavobacterium odoriferum TaxID=2946604 RepID=UPI0021CAED34|nr:acetyltransferase [Flavobacterium sp. HXWNR29]
MEPFSGTTSVYVFGAGGHGKVVLDVLLSENKYVVKGILDDAPQSDSLFEIPIKKNFNRKKLQARNCIVAIGDNAIRKRIVTTLDTNFIMTIHPNAIVSKFAKIGPGTQIMAAAVVNPAAVIGNHCIINTGAIVEHDCKLEDYVHVAPNACLGGNVTVGEKTLVGIGATIIPNVKIGKNVSIGAGTVVLQDVPDNAVVVGVPARIIKYQEN